MRGRWDKLNLSESMSVISLTLVLTYHCRHVYIKSVQTYFTFAILFMSILTNKQRLQRAPHLSEFMHKHEHALDIDIRPKIGLPDSRCIMRSVFGFGNVYRPFIYLLTTFIPHSYRRIQKILQFCLYYRDQYDRNIRWHVQMHEQASASGVYSYTSDH